MSNLSITLKTQAVNVFGPAPSNQWNVIVWGVNTWGEKAAGIAGLNALLKNIVKLTSGQVFSLSDAMSLRFTKVLQIQAMFFATDDFTSEQMSDGRGYKYVLPGPTIENERRVISIYSSVTNPNAGWTVAAASSTSWS